VLLNAKFLSVQPPDIRNFAFSTLERFPPKLLDSGDKEALQIIEQERRL